jgi:transcription antitermination factor NusG
VAWFSRESLQDPSLPWVAVRTRVRSEKLVARVLTRWGCEAWAPTAPVRRQWSDRTKVIEWPLFPGYVFARVPSDEWYPLLDIHGVQTVVKDGRRAAVLSETMLSDVRGYAERLGRIAAQPEHVPWFEPGDIVLVTDGPFAGVRAMVTGVQGLLRVSIGLTMLGQGVAVTLPAADLERVPV